LGRTEFSKPELSSLLAGSRQVEIGADERGSPQRGENAADCAWALRDCTALAVSISRVAGVAMTGRSPL